MPNVATDQSRDIFSKKLNLPNLLELLLTLQGRGHLQNTCYLQDPTNPFSAVKAKLPILLRGLSIGFLKC